MVISENLFEKVLISPARRGFTNLKIISGYASSSMVNQHLAYLYDARINISSIELIIGMASQDGINIFDYKGFMDNVRQFDCFSAFYSTGTVPIHSKIYIWSDDFGNTEAYIGSANYTQNAFLRRTNGEVLSPCDSQTALSYYTEIAHNTINCTDHEVPILFTILSREDMVSNIRSLRKTNRVGNHCIGMSVSLSLLTKNEEIHEKSASNWGQRNGREHNQAYIPIPITFQKNNFFPKKGEMFNIITDDDVLLVCSRAQGDFGKAIHTTYNNSEMGQYFRNRIGVPYGYFITKEDLLNYGRTEVKITKINNSNFYMDFSIDKSLGYR